MARDRQPQPLDPRLRIRHQAIRRGGTCAEPVTFDALIGPASLVLLVLDLYWQQQDPWPQRGKETPMLQMYSAWCICREGEDCSKRRVQSAQSGSQSDLFRCWAVGRML